MTKRLEDDATLLEREDLAPTLAVFRVRPDRPKPGPEPWFVPGQYIVLGLNDSDDTHVASVRRPMSLSSSPLQHDVLEFYVRHVDRPTSPLPFTHLLWRLQAGARMHARLAPAGMFTLPHTITADDRRLKLFVAAGTGLAPFISMVRYEAARDPTRDLSDMAVLHGASYPQHLGFRDSLERLSAERGLHYFPSISREASTWCGANGRVEDWFTRERLADLEARLGLPRSGVCPERVVVYVCGLRGTIGTAIERLLPRGFVPSNRRVRTALGIPDAVPASLFYEQYDTSAPIDVKDAALMSRLRADMDAALATAG